MLMERDGKELVYLYSTDECPAVEAHHSELVKALPEDWSRHYHARYILDRDPGYDEGMRFLLLPQLSPMVEGEHHRMYLLVK